MAEAKYIPLFRNFENFEARPTPFSKNQTLI